MTGKKGYYQSVNVSTGTESTWQSNAANRTRNITLYESYTYRVKIQDKAGRESKVVEKKINIMPNPNTTNGVPSNYYKYNMGGIYPVYIKEGSYAQTTGIKGTDKYYSGGYITTAAIHMGLINMDDRSYTTESKLLYIKLIPCPEEGYISSTRNGITTGEYPNSTGYNGFEFVTLDGKEIKADKIILATGGKSYPVTGSTGDGYRIAKDLGHTITKIEPSLVPLTSHDEVCKKLQGLSLRNVAIQLQICDKVVYKDFGEMLFTHFGVSGPIVLSASSYLVKTKNIEQILKEDKVELEIDLKPALSEEKLDARILRDFEEQKNKQFKNSLDKLLPQKLIPVIIEKTNINESKKINEITKQERQKLVNELKHFKISINGTRPIEEAIVTSGGINIKEINPKTMESKLINGLYFAGEIIDVDCLTGGYNLQVAWSTGYTAGIS